MTQISYELYIRETGTKDAPAILFLHGSPLSSRMWEPQFDALARSYMVVRYDASGYGRSTVPDSSVSGTNELAALLRFLGIKKATLVGMSMGANEAIKFTLEHPEAVEALVTVGSTLDGYIWRDPLKSVFRHVLATDYRCGGPHAVRCR